MLTRLQWKYAKKPVRFILVPCNQFGHQEPAENEDIKKFAEQFVRLGPRSNVVMLAKSNLNGDKCTYDGEAACKPWSKECCPANDPVYDYLLPRTAPAHIKWNFDKVIVDVDGKPYKDEIILRGNDLEDRLSTRIDWLLAGKAHGYSEMLAVPWYTGVTGPAVIAAACAASFVGVFLAGWRVLGRRDSYHEDTCYVRVTA